MPSPIGHALGGALFGGVFAGGRGSIAADPASRGRWWRDALVLAGVGLLPDLDFLLGIHSRYTHSVGAIVAAGVVAWLVMRFAASRRTSQAAHSEARVPRLRSGRPERPSKGEGAARGDGAPAPRQARGALSLPKGASDRAGVWGEAPREFNRRLGWALAVAAAYGSHLLFDWLGSDTTPPIGIMALWPLSDAFFQSDVQLFMAISRRYWLANFWSHNLTAVAWEVGLLGPPTLVVWWWRSRFCTTSR